MVSYKNFNDIMEDLFTYKEDVYKDEEYHWWTGNIDGCYNCGFISSDERNELLLKLKEYVK